MGNDIDYFKTLSYDVLLKKDGPIFRLCIPELSCVVEDGEISAAYEKLERKKEDIFRDMVSSDMAEVIQRPRQAIISETVLSPLYSFIAKAAVVCGLIFISSLATVYVVHDSVKQFAPTGLIGLIRNQAVQVRHGLADMTDDERTELQLKIRATVLEVKPFIDELKVLWNETPRQASSKE